MTTARDIMTGGAECASTTDSLVDAARKLRDLDVGDLVEAISSAPPSS